MASSARSRAPASTSRPSASNARQTSRPANLPVYQPLNHALNPAAQHALQNLPRTHPLNELKRRLQTATNHLTEVTGDLNDQYRVKKVDFDKAKARKAARARELGSSQDGNGDDDEADRHMADAWKEVEDLTGKMEAGTRKVIDIQARVDNTETALKELDANVSHGRTTTQSTLGASQFPARSQQRRQQRRQQPDNSDEDHDDGDNAGPDEEDTFTGPPALAVFKDKLSTSEAKYTSLSMKDRYASHNNYIGFRQILHDARHPNDDTPIPHASTWFPSSQPPNNTQSSNNNNNDTNPQQPASPSHSDSDSEIQIAREKRSIRCPITLLPLHNPLTSTLCPHSFESDAILNMLSLSPLRADVVAYAGGNEKPSLSVTQRGGGGGGVNAMKCPECEVLLTKETLRVDAVLVRKIRRVEEMERRRREGGDDDDDDENEGPVTGRRKGQVEEVTSSPVRSRGQQRAQVVKKERMSQMQMQGQGQEREVSVVPDSQVVDLEDGEEEEEDEE
ncbi:MAG: hypothetical protein Q9178_001793 [Gyalolechia marmorata]